MTKDDSIDSDNFYQMDDLSLLRKDSPAWSGSLHNEGTSICM